MTNGLQFNCENCGSVHDGTYGSSRFCKQKCARAYSTKRERKEINKRVSQKLIGRTSPNYGKSLGPRTPQVCAAVSAGLLRRSEKILNEKSFESLSRVMKRTKILREQQNRCAICDCLPVWNNQELRFHLDHIDGSRNGDRENLRMVCPNCHSQTSTWCGRNISVKGRQKISSTLKAQNTARSRKVHQYAV